MEIKNKKKVTRTFYVDCPICKEEIKGTSELTTVHNLKVHVRMKHPEKDWNKEVLFK